MDWYSIVKMVHIISATILFGTGIGTAFFMFNSLFTDNVHQKLYAARTTVLADYIFTFPAGVIQPVTGVWLIWHVGYGPMDYWLVISYVIYIIALSCWLPVVWIQIQLKNILIACTDTGTEIPSKYFTLFKVWISLGIPAFAGLVVVFYLMVSKPT